MDKELIKEIIKYIEETEETIDGEWGMCRDFEQLLKDKEVPDLYFKVKSLLQD